MIPVNNIVNVRITSAPIFPARRGFGQLLIVGNSAILPPSRRISTFGSIDEVAATFGTSAEEYKAALAFYQQNPRPNTLMIGRRFTAAVPGENLGSLNYTSSIAAWQAITTGALRVTIDGVQRTIGVLNFAPDANLNAVAARIQAALILAGATGATVVFLGNRFVIRSGTTGPASSVSATITSGAGVYIGTMLGTDATQSPTLSAGAIAENAATALTALQATSTEWYGVTFTNHATLQDLLDAAAWTEARTKLFGYTTSDANTKDPGATSDIAYQLNLSGYRRTVGVYDADNPYFIASLFARAFAVNFYSQNATITLKFKLAPGQTPENLTLAEKAALDAKGINYYTLFGDTAIIAEGVMANKKFFDEVHGLDWFQNEVETAVFGFLYTRETKVPQTDRGMQLIMQQVDISCARGVFNGLFAPGQWNGDEFGELKTGDFLPTGYYTYAQPIREQNQSDRAARRAPAIRVAVKGSGAIHFVDIDVSFDN